MPQIEVSEETLAKIREDIGAESFTELNALDDLIGQKWFFRTVTYHMVGQVTKRVGSFVQLKNASWIADSGRFMQFIKDGVQENSEVEPVGECLLNLGTVIDAFPWNHKLPTSQK